jgi:tetratricopeptide (TPR) repeat protein
MHTGTGGEDDRRSGDPSEGASDAASPLFTGSVQGSIIQAGTVHGGVHLHPQARPAATHGHLPLAPPRFTGRARELARLRAELATVAARPEVRITVLTGTGGVGKTALATAFLRGAATDFPDGQLYADLAGFAPSGPADPAHLLDALLRALGAAPGEIPDGLAARSALFRARTAGRRYGFLLDNAVSAAQVRALLPGAGAHLVLVTTRLHLSGLVADGATFLDVPPMEAADAADLLAALVAGRRGDVDRASADRLADLCGRLPLAVCAAAGRLVTRPGRPVEQMIGELGSERRRLAALSRYGQRGEDSVHAVLDVSYRALPDPAARLYRLLGLHPGVDFDPAAAAALAGSGEDEADDLLEYLVDASLLHAHATGRRYAFHDLARLHARGRAEAEETEAEIEHALDRLVARHLATAVAADLVLNSGRWHLGPLYAEARTRPSPFPDRTAALDWQEAELANSRALVAFCAATGRHASAWQLCEALWALFTLRKHFDAWLATHEAGLASARALGDPLAEARMLVALGYAHLNLGAPDRAAERFERSRPLWERGGHVMGTAAALEGLGVAALSRGEPGAATAWFSRAREIFVHSGGRYSVALMDGYLGQAARDAGDLDAALPHLERARAYFAEAGDDYRHGRTLVETAVLHIDRGRLPDAEATLADAFVLTQRVGARLETGRVYELRGRLAEERGDAEAARAHLRRALDIYTGLGAPQAAATAERMARLGSAPTPPPGPAPA